MHAALRTPPGRRAVTGVCPQCAGRRAALRSGRPSGVGATAGDPLVR